jgi:4-hydroxy-tetrahydrodipicolinate reductase
MNIGVTGATGRMGGTIISAAANRDVDVTFAVSRDPDVNAVQGVSIHPSARIDELLETTDTDVVLDFTGPESSVAYAQAAVEAEVPILVGTTGFDTSQWNILRECGESIPVLHGANFARGIQALIDAVEAALATIPEYDVEVTETHHNAKRDAPSGTANVILEQVEAVRDRDEGNRVHGRVGEQPRETGEIGVHARRAGDITGEHEVLLAGNDEALSLSHRAGSRAVFAEGALDAAAWLVEQSPGFYRFADIAEQLA